MMLHRYKSILLISLIYLITISCSKEDIGIVPGYEISEVNFNLSIANIETTRKTTSNVSKTTVQNTDVNVIRGNTPLLIKGVEINTTHYVQKDQSGHPLTSYKTLYFADNNSDQSLSIPASINVVQGKNIFLARSISKDNIIAKNDKYENIIKASSHFSDPQKLEFYNEELNILQPIHAEYTGETIADIASENTSVNINMTTQQARLNIIFENDTKYKATFFVFYATDYANNNLIIEKANVGSSSAFIFNATDISSNPVNIYIRFFKKDGKIKKEGYLRYNGSYDIRVLAGVNKTIIYNLKKAKLNN